MITRTRERHHGIRKVCACARRVWPRCAHSWYLNYKPAGGPAYRFSVDVQAGKRIALKADAEALAERWREQIRLGTFRRVTDPPPLPMMPPALPEIVTLEKFINTYDDRGGPLSTNDRGCLRVLARFAIDGQPLGTMPIAHLTEDVFEVFFASLQHRAASTRNKYYQAITAMLRWAVRKKYLAHSPIEESETITHSSEKAAKRNRRLAPDVLTADGKIAREGEERRLLAVADVPLQRLIIGGIDSCCRRGELLALLWSDVNLDKREMFIRAEEAGARKTGLSRRLPISARLAAVLDMARTALQTTLRSTLPHTASDADVAALLDGCYVFGDAIGRPVESFDRAWETAVLKAHGHTPQWTKKNKALTAESRAALPRINLHYHDLRHEGASQLLEAGWPPHHVQHMLGHANLSQTSTYVNGTQIGMHESMRKYDQSGSRCNPLQSTGETDPSRICNDDAPDGAKVVVN